MGGGGRGSCVVTGLGARLGVGQCQFYEGHSSELEGFVGAVDLAHKALPVAVASGQV